MDRKSKIRIIELAAIVILACCFSGCHSVGPDYEQPAIELPDSWHSPVEQNLNDQVSDHSNMAAWWVDFNDPVLSDLVVRAIDGNKSLKVAHSRILQARAALGIESSELYPKLNLASSGQWVRQGDLDHTTDTSRLLQGDKYYQLYSVGLDSSWELDIFGGVKRSLQAAQASLEATETDMYDVLVTLSAEVAINYISLRQSQLQLQILEKSIEYQQEAHSLIRCRYESGMGDELAVHQSEYSLKNSRSQLPALNTAIQQACNRIAVLLGEQPGTMQEQLQVYRDFPVVPDSITAGVPADIIRRRPDIRSAESRLIYQTAKVGVAKADLYPHLILNGTISTSAASVNDLGEQVFDADAWVVQGGPQIVWNIFNAGAVKNNIKVQTHMTEQALLNYEQAILSAHEEVETALAGLADKKLQYSTILQAVAGAKQAAELADYQYRSGLAEYSIVLESERTMLSFENQLAQCRGAMAIDLIRLYKALGGGWDIAQLAQSEK